MRLLAVLTAAAGILLCAPVAHAATLEADSRCYQETEDIVLKGNGYRANSFVTISRAGQAIGSAPTKADGSFVVKFAAQELPRDQREDLFDLAATDGMATAITRYRVTKVFADFNPGEGNPSSLRVRFTVHGFSLLRKRANVYLHYVRPNGKVRRTINLGRAKGTCGLIRRTERRLLFPFSAERGKWILQFDTNRRYRRARDSSDFIWVRKPVEVFNRD